METKQSSHEDAKSAEEGKKAAEEDHLDEQVAEQKTVKTLTAKVCAIEFSFLKRIFMCSNKDNCTNFFQ
jgi:hypothetical protein